MVVQYPSHLSRSELLRIQLEVPLTFVCKSTVGPPQCMSPCAVSWRPKLIYSSSLRSERVVLETQGVDGVGGVDGVDGRIGKSVFH